MAETNVMRADEIASAFNGATERQYWRASIAGGRLKPEVHFTSRASMVRVAYRVVTDDFTVTFSRSAGTFGDFLASAYRSFEQVHAALKAAGLPVAAVVHERAVMRIEYDPASKDATVFIAGHGDTWQDVEPAPFKVPERKNDTGAFSGLDAL